MPCLSPRRLCAQTQHLKICLVFRRHYRASLFRDASALLVPSFGSLFKERSSTFGNETRSLSLISAPQVNSGTEEKLPEDWVNSAPRVVDQASIDAGLLLSADKSGAPMPGPQRAKRVRASVPRSHRRRRLQARPLNATGFSFAVVGCGELLLLLLPFKAILLSEGARGRKSGSPPLFAPSFKVQRNTAHNRSSGSAVLPPSVTTSTSPYPKGSRRQSESAARALAQRMIAPNQSIMPEETPSNNRRLLCFGGL